MSERVQQENLSRSVLAKKLQQERIAGVNHWRGQCLDNFARAEQAIIRCSERLQPLANLQPFRLEEAAAIRTRKLRDALKLNWPKHPVAARLSAMLDHWSIRERERNELVHGCFSVRPGIDFGWILVNELMAVKKGVTISRRDTLDARQADAFLKAIVAERKQLEVGLEEFQPSSAS